MTTRQKLEKEILEKIKEEYIELKLDVTFHKYDTYNDSIYIHQLYIDKLYKDGIITGNEPFNNTDEYNIYELTGDSLFIINDLLDETITNKRTN